MQLKLNVLANHHHKNPSAMVRALIDKAYTDMEERKRMIEWGSRV